MPIHPRISLSRKLSYRRCHLSSDMTDRPLSPEGTPKRARLTPITPGYSVIQEGELAWHDTNDLPDSDILLDPPLFVRDGTTSSLSDYPGARAAADDDVQFTLPDPPLPEPSVEVDPDDSDDDVRRLSAEQIRAMTDLIDADVWGWLHDSPKLTVYLPEVNCCDVRDYSCEIH